MNQRMWRTISRSLILSIFAVGLVVGEVWGQATFVSARHQTLSQREVDVNFDIGVSFSGAPTTTGWLVTVNAVAVPITSIGTFGPNTVRIEFDASGIAGHTAGQTFLKPGEILRVSYAGGGNFNAPGVNPFALQVSQNNFVFTCAEMIFFKQEAYASVDVCSPVVMNFTQYVYKLSLRFRNSSNFNLANIFYNIQWGDATVQNASPYISDIAGMANPTFVDNIGFTGSNPAIILTSRPSHNYPAPNPTDCSFNFTLTPFVNGVAACPSISTTTLFATYDTDNANSGVLGMPPSVPGSNLVCKGDNANMLFSDATLLNCRAAIEPIVPNESARHIRIVYGSRNYDSPSIPGAVNNIPDVRVGGVPVTNNDANGTLIVPTGYFPVGAGGIGVPDFNGVIQLATPVTAATATAFMQNITTTDPMLQLVDQRFYVRLEYWDICNPYNAGDPTNPAPVTIENFVQIIDSPNPPTTNNPILCESAANGSFNITATGVGGGTLTYTWYLEPALTTVLQATSTDNTFNPVTEGPVGNRINKDVAVSTIFNRYVTVTQGSNNCTSQPQTITIRIDALNTPGTIAHPLGATPITICSADDPVAFTSTVAGTGGGPGGTFTYQWQHATASGGPYVDLAGATSATYDPTPADIASRRFFRRRVRSGQCADVFSNIIEFRVDTPVTGGTIAANQTICAVPGDPANLTSTAGATGGAFSGVYNYQWEESTVSAAGPFNTIGGATATTYNPPAGVVTTTHYRRRVTSGVCTADGPDPGTDPDNIAYSNVITVTVNQIVDPGVVNNPQTICAGDDPAVLGETTPPSGGNGSTYTFQWQESATGGGAGFAAAPGVNTNATYDPPVLTATRFYRRRVTSGVCPATFSNEIQITVNPLPTAPNPTGGGAVRAGNPAPDIVLTGLTGTPPFNITYTINGVPQPGPIVEGTTTFTIASPLVAGNYQISILEDANNCFGTSLGGTATVTVGGFPPAFDSGPSLSIINACDDGAATLNPVLNFSLDFNSASLNNFTLRYTIDGSAVRIKNFNTDAAGDPIGLDAPITFTDAELNTVLPSPHVITIVSIISQAGCQTVFNTPLNFTLQPRPPTATNPVDGVACIGGGGAAISVADPALITPNTVIEWSTGGPALGSFANAVPGSGAASGTNNRIFTPTGSATFTYYAFVRNTSTNCFSTTGIAVQHTEDLQPAGAVAGPAQPGLCAGTATMASTAATNGGSGSWTVLGQMAYQQNFENAMYVVGTTTTSASGNGWTIDTSAPNAFPQNPGGGYFEVRAGKRFEAENTNGSLGGGGAEVGEVVWMSEVIDISSLTSVFASVDMFDGNPANDLEPGDYYNVLYKLNGGGEILFTTNGSQTDDFPNQTASVTGLAGATLQIVIRIATSGGGEIIAFDNVIVREVGSTVSFNDPNATNAVVSNLPQNPPGGAPINYTARWTVASALGACPSSSSDVVLTVNPLPTSLDPMPNLCEDVAGGGSHANEDLTMYNAAVTNAPTVAWYSNPLRTPPFLITTPVTVNNGASKIFYFTATGAGPGFCTNIGQITFTVDPLPASANQVVQICEDFPPGSLVASGINLQNYELVAAGGSMVNRDIEWYEDVTLTTLIPPGAAAGAEQNYSFNADKTIHAKIIDTSSPVVPPCFSQATLDLDYQARPNDNQMTDGIGQVVGATYTVCASSNLVLLQINPGLNPGSTYTWTVPPVSYAGEFELLTGTTDFFIILRLQNSIPAPTWNAGTTYALGDIVTDGVRRYQSLIAGNIGNMPAPGGTPQWSDISPATLYPTGLPISVKETLGTALCDGNTINTRIIVEGSPPKPIITGPASVCSNANGLVYSVTNPVAGTYAWSLPPGATITSLPVTASSITVQMSTFSGNVTVTHASGTGCTSPAADPYGVTVVNRPVITSPSSLTICSGADLSVAHTITSNIAGTTYNWDVINTTGFVTGTFLGDFQNGVLAINRTLFNTSGVTASVIFRITPIGPGPDLCAGTPQNFTVTINPEPVLNMLNKTLCSDEPAQYEIKLNPLNQPAGTTFSWPAPVMSDASGQGTASAGAIPMGAAGTIHINDAFVNTSSAPITATYTISATSGAGCPSNQVPPATQVVFTINPEPVGVVIPATPVCSDVVLGAGFTLATTGGSASVNPADGFNITAITIPGGITASAGAPVVANAQPSTVLTDDAWNNIGSASANVVYTIVPVASGTGCLGNPFTVTVQVDPEPVGVVIPATPICSDVVLGAGFTLSTTGTSAAVNAANGYNITAISIPAGVTATAGAPAVANAQPSTVLTDDAWNNIGNSSANVVYTVVPVSSAAGCLGNPFTVTVQVNPEPVGVVIPATPVCSDVVLGAGFTLTTTGGSAAVNPANGYNITAISIPGGVTASAGAPAVANGQSATVLTNDAWNNIGTASANVVYTIVPVSSAAGCLGDPFTVTVQVNPEPVGVAIPVTPVCSDVVLGAGFTLSTTGTSAAVNAADGYNITSITIPGGVTASAGSPAVANGQPSTVLTDDAWNNAGTASANVVYTVVPVSSADGCLGNPFTVTVQVDPEPVGVVISAPVCSDQVLGAGFTLSTTGGSAAVNPADGFNITAISIPGGVVASAGAPAVANAQPSTVLTDDAWNNIGTSTANVVYTVVPVSSGAGCLGNPFTITVQVNPEPVGIPIPATPICSDVVLGAGFTLSTTGTSASVSVASGYNITAISIPGGVTASAGAPAVANAQPANVLTNDAWNNIGSASANVVYTIVPVAAGTGCLGDPFTVTVQVDPEPVGIPIPATPVCSDVALGAGFTLTTTGTSAAVNAANGYNITSISIPGGITATAGAPAVANAQPSTVLIDDSWNNIGNASANVVYTIVPVSSADGCLGNPFTVTVQVDPEPVGVAIPLTPICSDVVLGAGFTLSTTGTSAAVSAANGYNVTAISIPPGVTASAGAPSVANAQPSTVLIDDAWNNVSTSPANVVYTIVPVSSAAGCLGNPFTVTVQVDPEPVGVAIPATPVCSDVVLGAGFTLTTTGASAAVNAANGYNITNILIPGGVTASAGAPAVANGQSSTVLTDDAWNNIGSASANVVYTIVPVSSGAGCLGNPFTVTVQVDPEPVGITIPVTPVCSDVALGAGFTLSTTGTSAAVNPANGYNITAISIPGGVSASAGSPAVANGQPATVLTDDAWNNVSSASANVVYTVVPVSSAAGCLGNSFTVTVQVDPEPVGIPIPATPVCSDVVIGAGFTLNTTGTSAPVNAANGYNITAISIPGGVTASAGSPAVANNQSSTVLTNDAWRNTGSSAANVVYTIVPIASGSGCLGDPFTVTVQVDPEPVGIAIPATPVCSDVVLGAGFTLTTTGGSALVNPTNGFNITNISIPGGVTASAGAPAVANAQSSTVLTNDAWNNIGSVSANVVYTIVPVALGTGCLGDPFTVTVQVDPEPVGIPIPVTPVCSDVVLGAGFTLATTGTSAAVNPADGFNITSITIPAGITASAGAPAVANAQPSTVLTDDAWNNVGSASANVVYTIVPVSSADGCLGNPFTVIVQVDPEPVGNTIPVTPICSDVVMGAGFTLTTTGGSAAVNAANGYNITAISIPAGVTASAGAPAVANGQSSTVLTDDAWNNIGSASANVVYTIVPVSSGAGCLGNPFTVTVQVDPEPVGISIPVTPVCSDVALGAGFTLSTTGTSAAVNAANGYNITNISIPGGVTASAGSPSVANGQASTVLIDDAWNNISSAPANVVYTIVPVASGTNCLGNPFTVTVQVDPEPVGVPISAPVCSDVVLGAGFTLSTTGTSAAVNAANGYNITAISIPAGITASAGAPAVANAQPSTVLIDDAWNNIGSSSANVVYTIVPVASGTGCLGNPFTVTVQVNPEPVGIAIPDTPVCSDVVLGAGFTLTTTGGSALVNPTNGFNITNITIPAGITASAGAPAVANGQSSTVLTNDAWNNIGSASANVVYTIVPVALGTGCLGDPFTVTVQVDPEPVGVPIPATPVCSDVVLGAGFTLATTGTSAAVNAADGYNITNISIPAGITASAGAPAVANSQPSTVLTDDAWNNVGSASANVVYTIVPVSSADGCLGNPFTVTVQVDPEPVGNTIPVTPICSDVVMGAGFTLTTTGGSAAVNAANGYNITNISIPAGVTASAGAPAVANGQPSTVLTNDAWNNIGSASANVVYTIVPVSSGAGCLGNPFTVTVQVDPEPVGIAIPATPVCSDVVLGAGFTLATTGTSAAVNPANGYNITNISIPAGVTASAGSPAVANGQPETVLTDDAWNNVGSASANVVYTIVPVASGTNCLGDPFTVTVQVDPEPVGVVIPATPVCSDVVLGAGFSLSTTGTSAAVNAANGYNITAISIPAGITASAGAPAVANAQPSTVLTDDAWNNIGSSSANVVYTIVPVSSADGCLGDPFTVTVQVNPEAVGIPIPATPVCSDVVLGAAFTLTTTGSSALVNPTNGFNITNISIPAGITASAGAPAVANGQSSTVLTNDAWNNIGSAAANVVYTVVPVALGTGCLGDPFTVTVQVDPEPVGIPIPATPVCSDVVLGAGFTLATTGTSAAVNPADGFNITNISIPAGITASAGAPAVANGQPSTVLTDDAWNNIGSASANVVYTVVPVSSADGCLGNAFTVTVQVDPEPVGNTIAATPVCSDVVLGAGFTLSTTGTSAAVNAANGYNITNISIPAGVTASAGAPAVANGQSSTVLTDDAWSNLGSASANVVYTVVPVSSAAGCLGNPFTVTVQVNPEPVGIAIPATPVCSDVALGAGFTLTTTVGSAAVNAANGYNITAISIPAGITASAGSPAVANGQPETVLTDDAWNNVGSASANVVYTIVPVASGTNCLGNPFTVTVQVDPEPVGISIPATPVCSDIVLGAGFTLSTTGTSAAVNAANGFNITNISIPAGITASAGAPAVANGLPSTVLTDDAWNNPGSASANVVYTIVPVSSAAGCLGNPFTVTVQVNPEPVLFNPGFPAVCSSNSGVSNPVNIVLGTNGTSATAASYQIVDIQYDDGGGFNPALPANFSRLPGANAIGTSGDINWIKNDKYNNTRNAAVTVRYVIQGTSSQGCLSELLDYDVIVNPEPVLLVPVPAPVCSDVITSMTLQETVGSAVAASFNINNIIRQAGLIAGGSNASIGLGQNNMAIFNDTFTNTTASNLTVTYKIAPVTALGCVGVQQDLVLTIQPAPAVASLSKAVCSTETTGIILSATGSSAPVAVPNGFNILGVSIQAGLTQTAGNTGVRMAVTSTEIQNDRFTNPGNTPLTVTYTIQGVTSAGCVGPTSDVVLTVEPTITAAPVNNSANICSATQTDIDLTSPTLPTSGNITFNYTAVSSVGGQMTGFVPALNNLPNGYKITDNLVNNSNSVATLTYTITPVANGAKSGAGCTGAPVPVVVNVEPKPKLTASPLLQTVCESDAVNASPTNILLTTTTVPSAGTVEFVVQSVVLSDPGMTLLAPAVAKTTYLNNELILDQWTNPTLVDQTVTYTLRPQVNGGLGCPGDDVVVTITVKPRPIINPVAAVTVCSGEYRSIPLTTDIPGTFATWTVPDNSNVTGELNGGGGSLDITLFNTSFTAQTVTYTVTPKFNNCDGIPIDIVVTVNPTPNTTGLPATITVCDGATLNVPITSDVAGTTFDWVVTDVFNLEAPGFFDGSGTTINQVINNANGFQAVLIYQVTPTSPGGCVGLPRIMNVNVGSIVANVTPDQTSICSGGRIQMTNSSLGATSHRWFYRVQGTTTEIDVRTTPFVNYPLTNTTTTNPLVYEIVYQPSNGLCTIPDVVTPITVYRNVVAGLNEGTVPPIVGGTSTVNFTNTSNPVDGTQFRYEWNFGSSMFANPPTFTGANPPPVVYSQQGPYQITIKAVNIAAETAGLQCENTFFKTIVVPVLPLVADFTLDPIAGCFPTIVRVIDNQSTGDVNEWQVVNSNGQVVAVSGEDLPEFFIATPGIFTVQLTTRDSFTDQVEFANQDFEIYTNPVASFQARPTTVFVPDTELTTFNFSTGANEYSWDFGDGNTSQDRDPKHIYKIEGVYDIVLIAAFDHDNGVVCRDTLTQQVIAKQGGQTKIPNAFTPNPAGPSGGLTGGGGTGGAGSFNDVFLPIVKGVEEFNMQIFDRWGNLIFESNNANQGWDGYDRNGNILPSGVYIYKLTLRLSDGQRTTQIGDITMIR